MTFEEALAYARKGKKIRRKAWGSQSYIYWNDKLNKILTNSGNEICLDNLKKAEDWIIIVDKKYRKVVFADLDKPVRPEEQSDESQNNLCITDDNDPIHSFFGLTYAKYLTLPRSILQSMHEEWQKDFVKLLEILDITCINMDIETPDYTVLARKDGKFIKDPYKDYYVNGQRCRGLRNVFVEKADER